jgi:hypothetical protein
MADRRTQTPTTFLESAGAWKLPLSTSAEWISAARGTQLPPLPHLSQGQERAGDFPTLSGVAAGCLGATRVGRGVNSRGGAEGFPLSVWAEPVEALSFLWIAFPGRRTVSRRRSTRTGLGGGAAPPPFSSC